MEQKKDKPKDLPITITVRPGSAVKKITVSGKELFRRAGLKYNDHIKTIQADWNQNPPESLGNGDEVIGNDEFVRLACPNNQELLSEFDKQGFAWNMSPGWYKNLGALLNDMGACGNPNNGQLMAKLNEEAFCTMGRKLVRAARDYALEKNIISQGNKVQEIGRIPINLTFSTVGAMGNGGAYWFITEGLDLCTSYNEIKTKLIVHLVLRGSLSIQNLKLARLNEAITLKQCSVWAGGTCINLITGLAMPIKFSYCNLTSNINESGNFTNLSQLLHHEAHAEFFCWATPAGNLMRERACDIEGITYNQYDEPQCGQTFSVGLLTCGSRREIKYDALMANCLFCLYLAQPPQGQRHINEAIALARNERILETEDENLLTADIIRPEELGHENVISQSQESIWDRIKGSRGMQKAVRLDEAIADTLNNDLLDFYEPAMKKQAQSRLKTVCDAIKSSIQQHLRTATGLAYSLEWTSVLRQITADSQTILREQKRPEIESLLIPHQSIIAEASEKITQLQNRGPLTRWMSFFLIRRLCAELEESGLAAVAHQMELSCCQIADRDLLTPLLEFLDDKIGWLASALRKSQNIAQASRIQADRLAGEDTTALNPNGYELTTAEYLNTSFKEYLAKHGGPNRFYASFQDRFMKTYNSMEIFLETPQSQLQDMLYDLAEPIFEPVVQATTVWDKFIKTYPNPHTRQEILTKLIKHSEGRVITEDTVGQSVVWVKTANVPDASLVEPVRTLLESLDKKSGTWEVTVHEDNDTISIGQLRGAIHLSPFIRRLEIPDNEIGWRALARQAIDVVIALIIPPNPNLTQFKRVLAKAVIADLIILEDGCFYLQQLDEEPLALGSDFTSVKQALIKKWRKMVYIESMYARKIITDESTMLHRLENIQNNSDLRCSLFDQKAIDECRCQTEIMLPQLRRMRVAAMREQQI